MRNRDTSRTPAFYVLIVCVPALIYIFGTPKGVADGRPAAGVAQTRLTAGDPSKPDSTDKDRQEQKRLDPAAWGGNHVGKPIPDFVHGDDCLFCHRDDIGPTWQKNSHGITVRQREDAPALAALLKGQPALASFLPEVGYFMGSRHHVRFLKKEGYGEFAILSTQADLGKDGKAQDWKNLNTPKWDAEKFGNQCAGCHATAVDVKTKAFSAFGLDCYTCHGNVNLEHTNDTSLIFLSKKSKKDPKAIESACA
ncbi:MAG: multiheme c-type cytochrome, partial [Blastocatellia bacterium]